MKKQKRQMILILALLLVFGSAYAGMRAYNQNQSRKEAEEAEAAKIYVTNVKKEEITAFSYQSGGETLLFVKEGEDFILENDREIKLDQSEVEAMAETVSSVEAEDQVNMPGDLAEYGFDAPENVITLTTAKGQQTLTIGMQNPVTGQLYLTKSGDDTSVYLVDGGFSSSFEKTKEELRAAEDSTAKEPEETED